MTISEATRNDAYYSVHNLPESQARVLNCILEHGPISTGRICRLLGWTPNRATGRVDELRKAGLVTDRGTELSEFNKRVVRWAATPKASAGVEVEQGQALLAL